MNTFTCSYCGKINTRRNSSDERICCDHSCASKLRAEFFYREHPELREQRNQIIESFKITRSQTETAKIFNLTRERIRQIVKKYAPELNHPKDAIVDRHSKYTGQPCKHCKKKINIEVKYFSNGYCKNCIPWVNNPNYEPKPKYTECSHCGIKLGTTPRFGLCDKCYSYYRYQIFPEVRKKASINHYKWHKKKMATDPAYKARFNAYQRKYSQGKSST